MNDLIADLRDARRRLLELVTDLDDKQWMGPRLDIVNPIRWEIAHIAWFQEKWVLRHANGEPPIRADGDALYDSAKVPHDSRWDLPLPSRQETLDYMQRVLDRVIAVAQRTSRSDEAAYFFRLALFHEDIHAEALTYTRQTLGYPTPRLSGCDAETDARVIGGGPLPGDARVEGCRFFLGAPLDEIFVFDNEKWAHPVEVAPFAIARAATTCGEFAAFVDAGGYETREFWGDEGWAWRTAQAVNAPVYWQRAVPAGEVDAGAPAASRWLHRWFDAVGPVSPHQAMVHVSWYEAEAYCKWAKRRLPTEAEWELAAASVDKRRFPWGSAAPDARLANLDGRALGVVDVGAHGAGDSSAGCRQMIGNVWEWTATDFQPYPGFITDPYAEYSEPWFASPHKVLRGGCWATRGRLLRNTWRNFYPPHRRDVIAGFRTAALSV